MPIVKSGEVDKVFRGIEPIEKVYRGTELVWSSGPPVVSITGTSGNTSYSQFRAALTAYGVSYATVTNLPFLLDTSQATVLDNLFYGCAELVAAPQMDTSRVESMNSMFRGCAGLAHVPDLATGNVVHMTYLFYGCASLTDGNVRLIGRSSYVNTANALSGSGLTRLPFFDAAGNPI